MINLVAVGDGFITHARVRANRSAGSFTGVVAEGLHTLAEAGVDGSENLGARDATLSPSAVKPDFQCHNLAALRWFIVPVLR